MIESHRLRVCNKHLNIDELFALRYIMSMIMSICQHCDEQQFQKHCNHLSTLHDFRSSKVRFMHTKIRALLLDHILALKKTTRLPRVHLVTT